MDDNPDDDSLLEEVLRRIAHPEDMELTEALREFSKVRMKAFAAINGLKDSVAKKQDLTNLIEEMSILFFQNGVRQSMAESPTELAGRITSLEAKIDGLQTIPSYAEAAKQVKVPKIQIPTGKTVPPITRKVILVTPLAGDDKLKTCDDTKKALLSKVKPRDLGIKPDRILKSGKTGIKIEAKEIDITKVNQEALRKAGLQCHEVGKLKPRLAVFGVPKEVEERELKDEILITLGQEYFDQLQIKSKFGPRDKPYTHWVIEVSPKVRSTLLQAERLYIGWSSCIVKDHVRIIRCFKCQKFGHLQKDCRGEAACGHCAGAHDTSRCRSTGSPPVCLNCTRAGIKENNHEARSPKCQVFIKRTKDTIANTDYGQ